MTDRRFHTDSRAGENFTQDGVETLTGDSHGESVVTLAEVLND